MAWLGCQALERIDYLNHVHLKKSTPNNPKPIPPVLFLRNTRVAVHGPIQDWLVMGIMHQL